MSSATASSTATRGRARVSLRVSEPVRSLGFVLTICYVSMSMYIVAEAPEYGVMAMPANVFLLVTLALIVVPTIVLFAAGCLIQARRGDRALNRFNTILMLMAVLLYMRQAEIHSESANDIERDLEQIFPVIASIVFGVGFSAIAFLIVRFRKTAQSFFTVLALPALVLTAALPFCRLDQGNDYAGYSAADVGSPDAAKPPVIVLVFDEFSTDALLNDEQEIDAGRFPNFARLGKESLFVEGAQSNFFHTWIQIPFLADSSMAVSSEYDPRLFMQLYRIERIYADGCGSDYTCRGMRYVSEEHELDLSFRLAARAVTRPIPTRLLDLTGDAGLGIFDAIGVAPPSATKSDVHVLTKDLFATFLKDIDSEASRGQLYFVHSLLPHVQYVFDGNGDYDDFDPHEYEHQRAIAPDNLNGLWPNYLEQVEYTDKLLGQLIAKLEAEGLWDDAVLIVTADHGARREFPTADDSIDLETMTPRIPLFIKAPGIGPSTPHLDYQHVDFGPTLYDILDVEPDRDPASTEIRTLIGQGRSIFGSNDAPRPAPFYVNYRENIFWRYDFDQVAQAWQLTETFNEPIPDKTAFN
jgi:sulfatase-like protein